MIARARLLTLLVLGACAREPSSEPSSGPGSTPSAVAALSRAPRPARPVSSEALRTLAEIRERSLSLVAPAPSFRRIAFGRHFLVQLKKDSVVLRSIEDGAELATTPIVAHAATALPLGHVLVAGTEGSYRFEPGARAPRAVPRVSLLPGSELHPSRESPDHVFVVQTALRDVLRYTLEPDAGLGLEQQRPLPGYDGRAITTLLDGSFLYTMGTGLARATARGTPRELAFDGVSSAWRLLAADRIDRAWVVTGAGELVLLELGARAARVVRRSPTGLGPFDVAATRESVAMVSVEEAAERRFMLSVFDSRDGKRRFERALPSSPATPDPDWVGAVTGDRQVAVTEDPPRVAVGGPNRVSVFDLDTGKPVFEH